MLIYAPRSQGSNGGYVRWPKEIIRATILFPKEHVRLDLPHSIVLALKKPNGAPGYLHRLASILHEQSREARGDISVVAECNHSYDLEVMISDGRATRRKEAPNCSRAGDWPCS